MHSTIDKLIQDTKTHEEYTTDLIRRLFSREKLFQSCIKPNDIKQETRKAKPKT